MDYLCKNMYRYTKGHFAVNYESIRYHVCTLRIPVNNFKIPVNNFKIPVNNFKGVNNL